jgi:hypothetical protein
MGRRREHVCRSRASGRDDGVALSKPAKKKLECTDLVAGANGGIPILALDPHFALASRESFDRGWKCAKLGAWQLCKRRESNEERNHEVTC